MNKRRQFREKRQHSKEEMTLLILKKKKKMIFRDFPGGPMVKNLPAGVMGSVPDPERLPHAVEQLSLCAATTDLMSHNY